MGVQTGTSGIAAGRECLRAHRIERCVASAGRQSIWLTLWQDGYPRGFLRGISNAASARAGWGA